MSNRTTSLRIERSAKNYLFSQLVSTIFVNHLKGYFTPEQ